MIDYWDKAFSIMNLTWYVQFFRASAITFQRIFCTAWVKLGFLDTPMHVERLDAELIHTCFSLQVILIFCLVLVETCCTNELKNYSMCMTTYNIL